MRYQTILQAVKEVADSHKANQSFVTGLESDIDVENAQYPLIFMPPPSFEESENTQSLSSNTIWNLHIESQELLSTESTLQQKNEALDRTREILRDVYFKLVLNGMDSESITFNNVTEVLDFTVTKSSPFSPFVDLGNNMTGWFVDFSIQENNNNDLCNLSDVFA